MGYWWSFIIFIFFYNYVYIIEFKVCEVDIWMYVGYWLVVIRLEWGVEFFVFLF